jgi:hypothetical protein
MAAPIRDDPVAPAPAIDDGVVRRRYRVTSMRARHLDRRVRGNSTSVTDRFHASSMPDGTSPDRRRLPWHGAPCHDDTVCEHAAERK